MKTTSRLLILPIVALALCLVGFAPQAEAGVHVGIGIGVGSPGYYGPSPYYAQREWVPGYWVRHHHHSEWVPGHWVYR
ncbi:YXWGXW repeat-containing protein [Verrucomicrobium sp. GAS474]|uniref:YXWGXW repeat-containing protein n=1 Tax=Verrucomicrobium sp. GAS474 TaxID=1882831 RepID=UPI00087D28EE|nr:YXWGXW repeat-containing protein [Verrucomicrobium sp. GAS474]SDT88841.1 YXWGXW repeat-containing protein [Verrucomicrobium sp. GAS474]